MHTTNGLARMHASRAVIAVSSKADNAAGGRLTRVDIRTRALHGNRRHERPRPSRSRNSPRQQAL